MNGEISSSLKEKYEVYRQQFENMISKHATIWERYWCLILTTMYQIQQSKKTASNPFHPYRAGPHERYLGRD